MKPAAIAVVLLAACVQAESPPPSQVKVQEKQVIAPSLVSVRIAPRTPSPKPPLLLLLHGVGTDEHDLEGLAPQLDPRFLIRSVRAPFAMGPGRNAWFQFGIAPDGSRKIDAVQAEISRKKLLAFLDEVIAADGVDASRVYLAGFSQGAIMSLSIALTDPDRIAGVVAMSGRILPEIEAIRAPAEKLAGLPILVVHGTRDDVLPIENGRASEAKLKPLPVALTYQEFEIGHGISRESLQTVTTWLTARLDGARRIER